ncbi:Phosphatidylinositol 3- and 4-kinase family protein [Trichomonas vaginalis G3]|uniref:phosphatidylinositol 3-kinase n=1 Tax=Trichomonas vaginalis (strain ATCC PRA-98 / G3) TaxID=412133 RepID=A2DJM8_TRIV3|nr:PHOSPHATIDYLINOSITOL KINASE family [Trichomonas vaginalis G3]EAY19428.1 Phosphatidylinositol 3- and 4-kinase family protein [Trichomonas vaginalis G3]KAI5493170.1 PHOSPHATIDYLINOSITOL KINASE family [Trichomonas vaginalis G3]|eukprot:XP_001580414.1 Phosphatidylinositol 3- and 4-kinase family protein [Trichomonas vaginalis G3]
MTHRIDLLLPNGRTFFLPLDQDLKGCAVRDFLMHFELQNYVFCRNSPVQNQFDILYSSDTDKIKVSENITTDFIEAPLTSFFVSDRNVTSKQQRMPLFVFDIDEFIEQNAVLSASIPLTNFTRKHQRVILNVKLPTDLCINIEAKISKTVSSIQKQVYEQLASIYGQDAVRESKAYRLGTMKGEYPSHKLKLSESPEMMTAIKLQQQDITKPQFVMMQISAETEFSKAAKQYISDLELKNIIQTSEVLTFNSSFSELRKEVESARTSRLEQDPLLARMRLNASDPPLTTCRKKNVPIKVDTRYVALSGEATAISLAIQFDTTASQAIRDLFAKMQEHQGIGKDLNPDNYALTLQGTDEVVAGNFPIKEFVCVRQFLLSVTPFMNFLLVDKNQLIDQIKSKELSYSALPEPTPEQQYKPIILKEIEKPSFDIMGGFPHSIAKENFSIFIGGCFNIPPSLAASIYMIRAVIIHGSNELGAPVMTRPALGGTSVSWNEMLTVSLQIQQLPRSARVAITLYNYEKIGSKGSAIATINIPVFNFDGWYNSGVNFRSMWNGKDTDPLITTCQCEDDDATRILFEIPQYIFPIAHLSPPPQQSRQVGSSMRVTAQQKVAVDNLRKKVFDPLKKLTMEEKNLIYRYRHDLYDMSSFLPLVLSSIDYTVPTQAHEIAGLLQQWEKPKPAEALSLLDSEFADQRVRAYAVECLESLSDDEIMLYMLQLVQALKYEMYDDSPLCRFLFRRGLAEPKFLGHQLFWQLISEAHISHIRRRFSSFVVNFLYGSGIYRDELIKGYKFTQELVQLNHKLCKLSHTEATEPFREALKNFDLPNEFHLPMDPRLVVDAFIVEKCKVMNSKKKPFWLTFHNAAPFSTEPIRVLFKVGDDLRQDQLTLQVMRVMEYLWRKEGIDLHMRCYGVLPTGFNQGFIEVVPNAITEQALQQEKGTFAGVWDNNTLTDYLYKVNTTEQNQQLARENFMYSSAGYAVATCVLGIADRHPGNIMLQTDGHFLHIDFGHFLGNFKTKLGYQRENAPFHFSPACANVLGDVNGEMFKQFRKLCGDALNILRHNSKLLVTLLMLMLGTGIPELQKAEDIRYMTDMMFLDKTDSEAKIEFDKLTDMSLDSTRTKLNNLFHNIAVSD